MTVLRREDIPRPVVPKETVEVAELGGEVIVQGLMLDERLAIGAEAELYGRVPTILSKSVVDAEGKPIFDKREWNLWGASHADATLKLFDTAMRLSGMAEEKKEPAPS
jgi:hypothetical protein